MTTFRIVIAPDGTRTVAAVGEDAGTDDEVRARLQSLIARLGNKVRLTAETGIEKHTHELKGHVHGNVRS
jgi:hypothetical protein